MRFILSPGAIANLDSLRAEYQKIRNVDLDKEPSMIGLPTLFGGTNVKVRSIQVTFLEKMQIILQANLLKEEDIKTPEQWQANLTASRLMIAACLYVQDQISRPKNDSALYKLINSSLGVKDENYLDEEDKEACYFAANRVISSSKVALEDANATLVKAGRKPFSEKEWNDFSLYLEDKCQAKADNPYTNYPITSITQPLFGAAFSYTGVTIGFLGGDVISHSTNAMSPRSQLTALVGSTLLALGPAGPTGVALFAPVIAGKIISGYCSVSLAHVLGIAMGILGQGVGMIVGLPLDGAYQVIWRSSAAISHYYSKSNNSPERCGVRIADGMIVIYGIPIQVTPESQLPVDYKQHNIEIKSDGKVYIDGAYVEVPETGVQFSQSTINELNAKFQTEHELLEQETTNSI